MARLAVLSYHTSPLAQPGTGDGGGMNVYVRELSSALARLGHEVDVYTRRDNPLVRDTVLVEPGLRVHHVTAGPATALQRGDFPRYVDEFTDSVATRFRCSGVPDVIHANYWLSGLAGHRLKHELDIPLIMTFHTLERVKADTFEAESEERSQQESQIFACADAVLASCEVEAEQIVRFYDATPSRVHVVPLGVEHAFFSPGFRPQARRALGIDPDVTMLLFVGRIQTLKGVDLALETLIEMRQRNRDAILAIIGGPSGADGRATLARLHERVAEAGVIDQVSFVAPQAHQLLSSWMRAADVTLVPSRAESFGLVALESSACGTPVVASAVGGLTTLVEPGVNGLLVHDREPKVWADAVDELIEPDRVTSLSTGAVLLARSYTWRSAAVSLAALTEELMTSGLVRC
jgi:D-inositol-3-phosphate glycosyltransferase